MHRANALIKLTNHNRGEITAAIVWIMNVAALFVYILTYRAIDEWISRVLYSGSCFFTLAYCVINLQRRITKLQLNLIIFILASLSAYYIFLIIYYLWTIDNYKYKIGVFLLTELITICFVFISGLKHGLFNDAKDML